MVPGLEVARISSHQWAISSRGFNGKWANKLLVLIDGRTVYTPTSSGVYWDTQDVILEDIERIEVIRGPGAAMWGANAVNGVINIITRSAKETQGGAVTAGGGNEDLGFGSVRYGGSLGSRAHYRVYSKYSNRTGLWTDQGVRAGDQWATAQGGLRFDWEKSDYDSWTFQGDGYTGRIGQNETLAQLEAPFFTTRSYASTPSGGNVVARWKHRASERSLGQLQFYYDTYQRGEALNDSRRTFDLDFHWNREISSRQAILWGLGIRHNQDSYGAGFAISMNPLSRSDQTYSGFLQDELRLVPNRLVVTAGAKLERNGYTGWEVQPDVRIIWTPARKHAVWAAFSRAVRTPSRGEDSMLVHVAVFPGMNHILNVVSFSGSHDFTSEELLAYQAGYRWQHGQNLSGEVTGFYNRYDRLRTLEPDGPRLEPGPTPYLLLPSHFGNLMYGNGRGLEVSATYKPNEIWRLSAGYSWLDLDLRLHKSSRSLSPGSSENDDPGHQLKTRSYLDLPFHLQWDTSLYYTGAIANQSMPAYSRLDTRIGWRPNRRVELSVGGQNLLDNRHPEFFRTLEGASQRFEIGRTFSGRIRWSFGAGQ
jgi:iron complex outermembrane receptor protein